MSRTRQACRKQMRVEPGDLVSIEHIEGEPGDQVELNDVLLIGGDAMRVGTPRVEGATVVATIQGRTGAQPAGADTVVSGTNLFTMTASATAFGAATDGAPGGLKTANAITDDSSADATGTLGYVRASSSSAADTPLDDHIDGEAGTSGADWIFNTLAIVSGAAVSASSWTITQPEL